MYTEKKEEEEHQSDRNESFLLVTNKKNPSMELKFYFTERKVCRREKGRW
jgi:hypothetical protein